MAVFLGGWGQKGTLGLEVLVTNHQVVAASCDPSFNRVVVAQCAGQPMTLCVLFTNKSYPMQRPFGGRRLTKGHRGAIVPLQGTNGFQPKGLCRAPPPLPVLKQGDNVSDHRLGALAVQVFRIQFWERAVPGCVGQQLSPLNLSFIFCRLGVAMPTASNHCEV